MTSNPHNSSLGEIYGHAMDSVAVVGQMHGNLHGHLPTKLAFPI